jgi:TRAP-type transport system periplasmic protein
MKAIRWILGPLLLGFAAHATLTHAESLTLTFAHAAVVDHAAHRAALQFAKGIESRSNGTLKLELFPVGEFGTAPEVLKKIQLGSIDMQTIPLNYLFRTDKAFAVVAMPYVFDSYEHAYRVLDGPAKSWFAALAEKQGFVILSNWEWGFRNMTNNKRPINKAEDMRGLKIRVPPVNESGNFLAALGAQTSQISILELRAALSDGLVDGQENPLSIIYHRKFYEVQKYLAMTQHVYYPSLHIMSLKSWTKLTPTQQKIVREESKAAGDGMRKQMMAEEDDLLAKMVAAGVKVTRPDPQPFRALMAPVYQQAMVYAGADNVRKFLKMVQDERKR